MKRDQALDTFERLQEQSVNQLEARKQQENQQIQAEIDRVVACLLYTSPSPRDRQKSRMPSSA